MDKIRLIDLPKITDPRGNLTFIEFPKHIPFEIKRVFWTYNVPGGEKRGGHAFRNQKEIIIALSGSLDVIVTLPSGDKEKFHLNRAYQALYLPPNTWRNTENFSTNSLSLHMSNRLFDESDYIRDFKDFEENGITTLQFRFFEQLTNDFTFLQLIRVEFVMLTFAY